MNEYLELVSMPDSHQICKYGIFIYSYKIKRNIGFNYGDLSNLHWYRFDIYIYIENKSINRRYDVHFSW